MSYYTGFSEDYHNGIKRKRAEAFNASIQASLTPYTYKDYQDRTQGMSSILRSGKTDYLDFVFNSVSADQVKEYAASYRDSMLDPFRFSGEAQKDRIKANKISIETKINELNDSQNAGNAKLWIEGNTLQQPFNEAMKDPKNAWRILPDSDLWEIESLGSVGARIMDLSNMYENSVFANNANASIMGSVIADSGLTAAGKSREMLISPENKFFFDYLAAAGGDGLSTDVMFNQKQIDDIVLRIGDTPDDYKLVEMITDSFPNLGIYEFWTGKQGEATIYESMFFAEGEWDVIARTPDPLWVGDEKKGVPGKRDILAAIIKNTETDDLNLIRFFRDNPDLVDDIERSVNPQALVKALNKRRTTLVLNESVSRMDGQFGFSGFMNMMGYGFATDPTLGLELAATIGMALPARMALKAGTLTARTVGAATDIASTARRYNKSQRIRLGLNRIANGTANKIDTVSGVFFDAASRLLPSRILSELVFPSVQALTKSGKFKNSGAGFYSWLRKSEYLPTSTRAKLAYRATAGATEGLIWGAAEYSYMSSYEDAMNTQLFGEETSKQMAMARSESGAFYMMVGAGMLMGGTLSPTLGAAFEGTGQLGVGIATGLAEKHKALSLNPDSWVTKVFNPILEKTLVGVKKVGNLWNSDGVDHDTAMVGQQVLRHTDPDMDNENFVGPRQADSNQRASENLSFLNYRLRALSDVARKSGHNIIKLAKQVVKDIPEGERLSVNEIQLRITRALVNAEKTREGKARILNSLSIESRNRLQNGYSVNGSLMEKAAEATVKIAKEEKGRRGAARMASQKRTRPLKFGEERNEKAPATLPDKNKSAKTVELEERLNKILADEDAAEANVREADQAYEKDPSPENQAKLDEAVEEALLITDDRNQTSILLAETDMEGKAEAVALYRWKLLSRAFTDSTPDDLGRRGAVPTLKDLQANGTEELPYAWFGLFFPEEWLIRMKENADAETIEYLDKIIDGSTERIDINTARKLLNNLQKENEELLVGMDISHADDAFAAVYRATGDEEQAFKKAETIARYEELTEVNILDKDQTSLRDLSPEEISQLFLK